MPLYKVQSPLSHNGIRYPAGGLVEMAKAEAKRLPDFVLSDFAEGGEAWMNEPTIEERILDAMGAMDAADSMHEGAIWTKAGKPDLKELRVRAEDNSITAAERDRLWVEWLEGDA